MPQPANSSHKHPPASTCRRARHAREWRPSFAHDISRTRGVLRALAKRLSELKEEFYGLSYRTGATKNDSMIDIDGGIVRSSPSR